ncbi:MBL fold metallo-hydrolase [Brevibacillus sp. H7]|uniref:MBL fold metallo-hydrolase n=1 Tax=Brevibacillus sp. H7 TaxID=3349138 RepID=UPI0038171E1D
MTNMTTRIADSIWAILTYEEAWKSYINSYVIAKNNTFLLIDSHLRKHRPYFQQALRQIGAVEERIEQVYFTHRHADHIGNADLFPARNCWIHLDDYYELDDFSQNLFGHTFTGSGGDVPHLRFRQLPFHTEGSVAFFDPETRVCFVGDHVCFFAAPLGEVVGYGAEQRQAYLQFVQKWKQQEPEKAKAFAEGLEVLLEWPIELLATGHGPILQGDISTFLKQTIEMVRTK